LQRKEAFITAFNNIEEWLQAKLEATDTDLPNIPQVSVVNEKVDNYH
jgi:hypothetical protein